MVARVFWFENFYILPVFSFDGMAEAIDATNRREDVHLILESEIKVIFHLVYFLKIEVGAKKVDSYQKMGFEV